MTLDLVPFVVRDASSAEDAPRGAIPVALYGAGGGSGDVESFLTNLPGYDPGNDKLVLGLVAGELQWFDPMGQSS